MLEVNVTEFRNHLPDYLGKVKSGEEVLVTLRGKVIARIIPAQNERSAARRHLSLLRKKCRVGDVVSPLEEKWEAESANP